MLFPSLICLAADCRDTSNALRVCWHVPNCLPRAKSTASQYPWTGGDVNRRWAGPVTIPVRKLNATAETCVDNLAPLMFHGSFELIMSSISGYDSAMPTAIPANAPNLSNTFPAVSYTHLTLPTKRIV